MSALSREDIREFIESFQTLNETVKDAVGRVDVAERYVKDAEKAKKRQSKLIVGLFVSVVLDISLTIGLGIIYHQLNEVQNRTSSQVLCPLYGVFIASTSKPPPPEQINTPEKKAQYYASVKVIKDGYKALSCN